MTPEFIYLFLVPVGILAALRTMLYLLRVTIPEWGESK